MNAALFKAIAAKLPDCATQITIKGRDTVEAFFTTPTNWKPPVADFRSFSTCSNQYYPGNVRWRVTA